MKNDLVAKTLAWVQDSPQHRYESFQASSVVQALLGAIHESFDTISVKCVEAEVHVHFFLNERLPEIDELICEIVFEVGALQCSPDIVVLSHVSASELPVPLSEIEGWPVYHKMRAVL